MIRRRIKRVLIGTGMILAIILLLTAPFLLRFYRYKSVRAAIEGGDSATALQRISRLPDSYDLEWNLWEDISWIPKIGWLYEHVVGCPSCAADGYPLLWHAARKGKVDVIDALLNKGASLSYKGDRGAEVLLAATISDNTNAILLLVRRGADLRDKSFHRFAAIHIAAMDNDPSSLQMIRFLADVGADVNQPDSAGRTPLDCAYTWNTNAVPVLLHYGARLGTSDWLRMVNKLPNNGPSVQVTRDVQQSEKDHRAGSLAPQP